MSEMEECSSAKVVPPDINLSAEKFFTDYRTNEIFWSLGKIKMLGTKAVQYIINERTKGGPFKSVENFIHRIFKYKLKKYEYWDDADNEQEAVRVPVNARHVKNLILAGCFDKVSNISAVVERYSILDKAATELGFKISAEDYPDHLINQHYFWSMQQIEVCGIGQIDYKRIFDNSYCYHQFKGRASYSTVRKALDKDSEGKKIALCATVTDMEEISYKDKKSGEKKHICKLHLQQNNDLIKLVCWNDFYTENKAELRDIKGKIVIVSAVVRYNDYSGGNSLNTYKTSRLFTLNQQDNGSTQNEPKIYTGIGLDFETSGLDCVKHACTQLAMQAVRFDTWEIFDNYVKYFRPYAKQEIGGAPKRKVLRTKQELNLEETKLMEYQQEALTYSGITMDTLYNQGADLKEIARDVIELGKRATLTNGRQTKPVLVGQNITFDIGFVQQLMCYAGLMKEFEKVFAGSYDFYGNFQPKYIDTIDLGRLALRTTLP